MCTKTRSATIGVNIRVSIDSLKARRSPHTQRISLTNVEAEITIAGRQFILQLEAQETPLAGNIVLQRNSASNILQMLTYHLADHSANHSARRAWISRQRAAGRILGLTEDMLTELVQECGSQIGTDGLQPLQLSSPKTGTVLYWVNVRASK